MNSMFRRGLLSGGLTAALSLSLLAPVLAQQGNPTTPKPHRRGMHAQKHHRGSMARHSMVQKLNLTEDQQTRLKTAREAFRQQVAGLRGNTTLTPEQKKEQFQAAHAEFRQTMQSILTPEQRQQMEAAREQAKARRGQRMAHRKGSRGGALAQELNLTADQKEKLAAARSAFQARVREIRGTNADQEQKKAQLREAATAFRTQVNSILTPEQRQKVETKLQSKRGHMMRHRRGPATSQL